ncbi:MAG: AAA family ATPase [Chlorobiaceae bacterium]
MEKLVEALSHPEAYTHTTGTIEVIETHISWIFLTESWAYKVKKPINLGFLDFSTIKKRHYYCKEELRLNRRLCPEIYLAVVPIVKTTKALLVDCEGEIIDYAVKMVRFDRTMELDKMVSSGILNNMHIDLLSTLIAQFHENLPPEPAETKFGHPDNLIKPVLQNFQHMETLLAVTHEKECLEILKAWSIKEHKRLYPLFLARKRNGFIRHCHGDMHTGNMVLWNNRILIFDCIEFNKNLSIIDVISDFAFLYMDLDHFCRSELTWRLLNNYLTETGDFKALPLLRFYAMYRAMVRAKVTAIRYAQTTEPIAAEKVLEEHRSYLQLALNYTKKSKPLLIITFGVSGSGKSCAITNIAPRIFGIHIRSDIERKRIMGLKPLESSHKESDNSIYTEKISRQTYKRLLNLAALCIEEGIPVIVDATFLKSYNRSDFAALAANKNIPFRILHFHAPEALLFERVQKRYMNKNDASEADRAVLTLQLETIEPLSSEEEALSISINTSEWVNATAIAKQLHAIIT